MLAPGTGFEKTEASHEEDSCAYDPYSVVHLVAVIIHKFVRVAGHFLKTLSERALK